MTSEFNLVRSSVLLLPVESIRGVGLESLSIKWGLLPLILKLVLILLVRVDRFPALHFRRFSLLVIQNPWKIHVIFVSGVVLGLAPTSSDVLAILGVLCE